MVLIRHSRIEAFVPSLMGSSPIGTLAPFLGRSLIQSSHRSGRGAEATSVHHLSLRPDRSPIRVHRTVRHTELVRMRDVPVPPQPFPVPDRCWVGI